MARRKSNQDGVRERVAVLETEWRHFGDDVKKIRSQLDQLDRYAKAIVLLGSAGILHLSGENLSDTAAQVLRYALRVLLG